MSKLYNALSKIYKYAISKEQFNKLLQNREQFAIVSVETAHERSFADEKAYRSSPVEFIGSPRTFEPIEKSRVQNLRKHRFMKQELERDYKVHEVGSQWAEETKSPGGEKRKTVKKEKSMFLQNISFHNAYSLAQKNGQESFIFKPRNGPPQLIPTNTSNPINIGKRYAYSSGDELYSRFLDDKSSIWFGFFLEDSIELPNFGQPYTWDNPQLKGFFMTEVSPEEAGSYIEKIRNTSEDVLPEKEEWLLENELKKKRSEDKVVKLLDDED